MTILADALIQTIGGLLGASAGAFLALRGVYKAAEKQISYDREKGEIKDIENFLKSWHVIDGFVRNSALLTLEDIKRILLDDRCLDTIWTYMVNSEEDQLSILSHALHESATKLDFVKEDYIPHAVLHLKSLPFSRAPYGSGLRMRTRMSDRFCFAGRTIWITSGQDIINTCGAAPRSR